MIIAKLFCGLGNQMFQYAAGLALAHARKTVLKLDPSWFSEQYARAEHERYGLDCFLLSSHFATAQEVDCRRGLQESLAENRFRRAFGRLGLRRYADLIPLGGTWHLQNHFHFYSDFFDLPDECIIDGTFQSEKFFSPVSSLLRKHFSFRFSPTPAVAALAQEIEKGEAVAVHLRRGDLLSQDYKHSHGQPSADYYKRACAKIAFSVPDARFYIFSDDIAFARNCSCFPSDSYYVDCIEDLHSYDALRLMSLCRHFVIASSTFSWWGAWLAENPSKIVIRPDPWFANLPEIDTRDLCPDGWLSLSRD